MKLLIITIYKLKMMLSDRFFFGAMIIIPLFIVIATGYALRYEKLNTIPVAVVDEDSSDYSSTLIDRLSGKTGLKVETGNREEALDMLKANKVEAVFVIKKGFQEKVANGNNSKIIDMVKSPSSFSAAFISEVIAGEVIRFTAGSMAADWVVNQYKSFKIPLGKGFKDEVIGYADSQWEPKPLMTIEYYEMEGSNAKHTDSVVLPAATAASTGIIIVFIMFYVLFSSGWLIEERRNGTLKRLVSGPDALGCSFAANVLSLAISGGLQVGIFSVIIRFAFGVDLFQGIWSFAVLSLYLLAVISVSMFLASVLKTPAQLQAGAPVFTLLTGFIGGCFWNFVEMPEGIRLLSKLTPQAWALEGINRLLINPYDLNSIVLPIVILALISLFLLPLSYFIVAISVRN